MPRMTVGNAINSALRLLNQYSITGTEVPLTYNDSADDVARMIDLINDAQMTIATVARPIHEDTYITVPDVPAGTPLEYIITDIGAIAEDEGYEFNQSEDLLFTPAHGMDRRTIKAPEFRWVDHSVLAVPNQPAGIYKVEYQRYPFRYDSELLKMTAQEREELYATELDNKPDTHEIIPYYMAAMVALDQNPKAYYALYNVWETRLARLNMKTAYAARTEIEDVYGFNNFSGVW